MSRAGLGLLPAPTLLRDPEGKNNMQGSTPGSGLAGKAFLSSEKPRKGDQSKAAPQGRTKQNARVMTATLGEHSAVPQHLAWLSRVLIPGSWTGTVTAKPEPGPLRRHNQRQRQHGPESVQESPVPKEGMKNRT